MNYMSMGVGRLLHKLGEILLQQRLYIMHYGLMFIEVIVKYCDNTCTCTSKTEFDTAVKMRANNDAYICEYFVV